MAIPAQNFPIVCKQDGDTPAITGLGKPTVAKSLRQSRILIGTTALLIQVANALGKSIADSEASPASKSK